jgi:hypothetical protein
MDFRDGYCSIDLRIKRFANDDDDADSRLPKISMSPEGSPQAIHGNTYVIMIERARPLPTARDARRKSLFSSERRNPRRLFAGTRP